jgi:hypothetical protein
MNEELKYQDTYGETFFYVKCKIFFSPYHHTEKSTIQVYTISPSLFIAVNENTKQDFCMILLEQEHKTKWAACAMVALRNYTVTQLG